MRQKITAELRNLRAERIDFLQWLFRSEPIDDAVRFDRLLETLDEINFCFNALVREGLVGYVGTFPYTVAFGKEVSEKILALSGWITYFNLVERENIENLPANKWLIGLRPLAAGKVFTFFNEREETIADIMPVIPHLSRTENVMRFALSYCLMHPAVKTNVLSINTMDQAKSLKKTLPYISPFDRKKLDYLSF